jgi:hypothetical protein
LVNLTNAPSSSSAPAQSLLPDTVVGFQQNTTQYSYASPAGTINDVVGRVPNVIGTARLSVTLLAGAATWTGYAAGVDAQQIVLRNVDTTNTLTLSTGGTGLGDPLSLPANRFFGQNDYRLPPGGQITMIYYAYGAYIGWSIG